MLAEIRSMLASDWPELVAIYKQGIATGNATFETSAPSWKQWQQSHLYECRLVARSGEEVVGWAALSVVSLREVYRGVAEVSFYVALESLRMALAQPCWNGLSHALKRTGYGPYKRTCSRRMKRVLRFHLACGFRIVGRREKIAQHHGRWRDILLLERRSRRVGSPSEESEIVRTTDG